MPLGGTSGIMGGMETHWVPSEGLPPVWVDFNRMGGYIVLLDLPGTQRDLTRLGITLYEGLVLNMWDQDATDGRERDDLISRGTVEWYAERATWAAQITWSGHESEIIP
jgi:hypothetical protein